MEGIKQTQVAENLIEFVHLLRVMGLRISAAEVLDSFRALEEVDLAQKDRFMAALQCTLIKRPEDLGVFKEVFRVFFAPPEQKQQWIEQGRLKELAMQEQLAEADEDLVFQGETLELTTKEKKVYAGLDQEAKEKLQDFLKQSSTGKNVGPNFKPLIESLVRGHLQYWQNRGMELEDVMVPDTGNEEWDYLLEEAAESLHREQERLLREDMQKIGDKDQPEAMRLIHLLSRRLATRLSRRYRQSQRRLRLDLRKSIRRNINSGGAMFRLSYKSKRISKPQILLICDVSGSMTRYSAFTMQFILGLVSVTSKIETFLFADHLKKTTSWFQKGMTLEEMLDAVSGGRQSLGIGTNLHGALVELWRHHRPLLQKNAIVIIVSDTKTINAKESVEELAKLHQQVREIVWLNTLPAEAWERHSTVAAFQPYCQMYQCNTIKDLETIISQQLLKM